jgi:hypothetical protein
LRCGFKSASVCARNMETIIERQVIRAALAFAVASAEAQSPDAIADMRDEAAHLIGSCLKDGGSPEVLRQWCDDAMALVQRLTSGGTLPEQAALGASAAILRLKLVVAQHTEQPRPVPKKIRALPKTDTTGSSKVLTEFIKQHPGMRTKDVIASLTGTLSTRTIKRYLAELGTSGALRRTKHEDGSVSYSVDTE